MKFIPVTIISVLFLVCTVYADEGSLLFLNENGSSEISQIQMFIIPGQANSTVFRIAAIDGNITNIALFSYGGLNVTLTPPNISYLAQGDFQLVNVRANISNATAAGTELVSIIVLTSRPEQRLLPLLVTIPETTGWNITEAAFSANVTPSFFGSLNITLVNLGNVPIIGHVSRIDLKGISWFDTSDFSIPPSSSLSRPLYYFIRTNATPGIYQANYTFTDSLGNSRRFLLNLTLPDTTPPAINISLSREELYPHEKVIIKAIVKDDVAPDSVFAILNSSVLNFTRKEPGLFEYTLEDLKVGNQTLEIHANDTAGNLLVFNHTFEVRQFDYLIVHNPINLYRFKLGTYRHELILSSISPVDLTVTLKSLSISEALNNSINITFYDTPLELGRPVNISVNGDVNLVVFGAKNATRFEGIIEIITPVEVKNSQPEIYFRGEFGTYNVAAPNNFSTNGIVRECRPDDRGVYENSSYICTDRYPIDTEPENLLFCQSKASHDVEIQGWNTRVSACQGDLGGARTFNWIFLFIVIIVVGGFLFKHFIIDRTDFEI